MGLRDFIKSKLADRLSSTGGHLVESRHRLHHPNIIAVYDRGEADGRPYIAMEYLQGRTLKQLIQKEGPLPPERAIAMAMQIQKLVVPQAKIAMKTLTKKANPRIA